MNVWSSDCVCLFEGVPPIARLKFRLYLVALISGLRAATNAVLESTDSGRAARAHTYKRGKRTLCSGARRGGTELRAQSASDDNGDRYYARFAVRDVSVSLRVARVHTRPRARLLKIFQIRFSTPRALFRAATGDAERVTRFININRAFTRNVFYVPTRFSFRRVYLFYCIVHVRMSIFTRIFCAYTSGSRNLFRVFA